MWCVPVFLSGCVGWGGGGAVLGGWELGRDVKYSTCECDYVLSHHTLFQLSLCTYPMKN